MPKRTHQIVGASPGTEISSKHAPNQLVEKSVRLGTGALTPWSIRKTTETRIDYVRGSMIYPLTWHNGNTGMCSIYAYRKQTAAAVLNIHHWKVVNT